MGWIGFALIITLNVYWQTFAIIKDEPTIDRLKHNDPQEHNNEMSRT